MHNHPDSLEQAQPEHDRPPSTDVANPKADPAPLAGVERDRAWTNTAIDQELKHLANLPEANINKPGSDFSIILMKLASIIKGSGQGIITPDDALNQIKRTCGRYPWLQGREIDRQWKRALKNAQPRFRDDTTTAAGGNGRAQGNAKKSLNIDLKNPKTEDYIKAFESLDLKFRLNEMDNTIEINEHIIDDVQNDILLNRMRDIGLDSVGWIQRAVTFAASENTYHPIKKYLDALEWDKRDHIGHFVEHYLEETTGFGKTAFRRWLIGAVAKIYEQAQNFMMVWDGPQGVGKSVLARWLCPMPEYFIEGALRPDDKDSLLRAISYLVWEVGELQATTRKADKEALKDFVSKKMITVRRSYGTYDLVKPSSASFIGTINEDGAGFLTDPTGSRRFVIININKIRWDYNQHVKVANLWAQAMALYKAGEQWWLTPEEKQQQSTINEAYQMDTPVAVYFSQHFRVEPNSDEYMSVSEIMETLELLGLKGNQRSNMQELSRLMKRLGAEQFRPKEGTKRPRAYRGVVRLGQENGQMIHL